MTDDERLAMLEDGLRRGGAHVLNTMPGHLGIPPEAVARVETVEPDHARPVVWVSGRLPARHRVIILGAVRRLLRGDHPDVVWQWREVTAAGVELRHRYVDIYPQWLADHGYLAK